MKRFVTVALMLFFGLVASALSAGLDTVRIADYNLLNYPGSDTTTRNPYFRAVVHSMKPDILVTEEMTSQAGVNTFLNSVMNKYQPGLYSTIPFHDGPDTDPEIFYKSSKVTFVRASYIPTALRDIGEFIVTFVGTTDTLRIYAVHLKASSGSANEQDRLAEATILRNYLNTLPAGAKYVIVGDYNTYTSSEPCLVKLEESETSNNGRSKDPLNSVGNWNNNAAFASIHTQSPRVRQFGGGSNGGMDDRFDIMLTSYSSLDANIITSTYTAYGNDGQHFNDSINRLPNFAVPDSVANGIHYASDHIPIFCNFVFGTASSIGSFALLTPANAATNQPVGGTLTWHSPAGATQYDVYLDTLSSPAALIGANQTDTTYAYSSLKYGKTYYWKVVAKSGSTTLAANNAPFHFTTVAPIFSSSAGSIPFGSVSLGANKMDSVTISNTGTASLVIDSAASDNGRFTVTPSGATVAPSSSRKYYVTFTPATTAGQTGNIRFYHNANGSPSIVTVSGSGVQLTITASAGANGSISPAGVTNVNYGSSQSYTITPTFGYHVDSVRVDGVNIGGVTSYTFNAINASHTIAASFGVNPYTITASSGPDGSISPSGGTTVNFSDSLVYTISPDGGYSISDVVVDGHSVGATAAYTFRNVNANHTIIASFTNGGYSITAVAGANGTVSPSGSIGVGAGADTTISISPNTGFHIDSVFVDDAYIGTPAAYSFTNVTANHTILAKFAINTYAITATSGANGTVVPSGSVVVGYGMDTTFAIAPGTGYAIDSLIIDGVSVTVAPTYTFHNVTANHTIAARFKIRTFTIAASAGANGSLSPTGSIGINYGTDTTVAVVPATGYHVDSVYVDGVSIGAVASYKFTGVTANHTMQATFAINTYIITASAGSDGSISPSGSVVVSYGSDTSFAVTPDAGFHTDSVIVDGVNLGSLTSYSFSHVASAHSISVSFSINRYALSVNVIGSGAVSASPVFSTYPHGTVVGLKAAADSGFRFRGWSGDVQSLQDSISLVMDGPKNITANFQPVGIFQISAYDLSFGNVLLGLSKKDSVAVTNHGSAVIHISSVTSDNLNYAIGGGPDSLMPGQSKVYSITFSPTSVGQSTGNVIFAHDGESGADTTAVSGSSSLLSVAVSLKANWNMISNPVSSQDDTVSHLYSGSSFPYAFSFSTSNGYAQETRLRNGRGYWEKFAGASDVAISGGVRSLDTISVNEGWNMIGSISVAVPVSSVYGLGTSIVSQCFGFAGGYQSADSIFPGKAYWVKVGSDGQLVIPGVSTGNAAGNTAAAKSSLAGKNTIIVQDAAGNKQTLYFGAATSAGNASASWELPPVPPSGVFDVRFKSQRFVEEYAANGETPKQLRIDLASAQYPVLVTMAQKSGDKGQVYLTDAAGSRLAPAKGGEGSIKLTNPNITTLFLNIEPVPTRYALDQNYPNPFNPTSTIRYSLPVDSRVVLKLYDVLGREVRTLLDESKEAAGVHQVQLDGSNLASGVYLYRLQAVSATDGRNSFSQVRRMILVK